jgi:hypothetical protein
MDLVISLLVVCVADVMKPMQVVQHAALCVLGQPTVCNENGACSERN